MSISAPEAHSSHLPDKIVRGAEEYVGGLADLGSILPTDLPAVTDTAEVVHYVVAAEGRRDVRRRAAEHLRDLPPGEQTRALRLARTAIVTSMAGELAGRARDTDAQPESRRLAIELASAAISRHYAGINHQQNIARRYV